MPLACYCLHKGVRSIRLVRNRKFLANFAIILHGVARLLVYLKKASKKDYAVIPKVMQS